MPFLATYYTSGDENQDIKNATTLSERFKKLASATNGELVIHAAETKNGFVIEYNSTDQNRDTKALGEVVSDLIDTFTQSSWDGLTVERLNDYTPPVREKEEKVVSEEAKALAKLQARRARIIRP